MAKTTKIQPWKHTAPVRQFEGQGYDYGIPAGDVVIIDGTGTNAPTSVEGILKVAAVTSADVAPTTAVEDDAKA